MNLKCVVIFLLVLVVEVLFLHSAYPGTRSMWWGFVEGAVASLASLPWSRRV